MMRPGDTRRVFVEKKASSGSARGAGARRAPTGTGVSSTSLMYSAETIGRWLPSTSIVNSCGFRSLIWRPSLSRTVASTVSNSTPPRNTGGCCGGCCGGDCCVWAAADAVRNAAAMTITVTRIHDTPSEPLIIIESDAASRRDHRRRRAFRPRDRNCSQAAWDRLPRDREGHSRRDHPPLSDQHGVLYHARAHGNRRYAADDAL